MWLPGSFSSADSATGEPTRQRLRWPRLPTDSNNIVVEARDVATGMLYIRRKVAGVWGSWTFDNVLQVAGGQTTTGGFKFTTHVLTLTGTVTPNAFLGNYQAGNNVGAFYDRGADGRQRARHPGF